MKFVVKFKSGRTKEYSQLKDVVSEYGVKLTNPNFDRARKWMIDNIENVEDVIKVAGTADENKTTVEQKIEPPQPPSIEIDFTKSQSQPDNKAGEMFELMSKFQQLFGGNSIDTSKFVTVESFTNTVNEIKKTLENNVKTLVVEQKDQEKIEIKDAHERMADLIIHLKTKEPVMMVGAAGSFKTSSAERAAKALNLAFYSTSVGNQTTKYDLLGHTDANGTYHPSPLYMAYKNGGVFLLDEMDAGNANTLTVLNSAISNGQMTFPASTQPVKMHENFRCIATANTYGTGSNAEYVGRNILDAASADRFNMLAWDYDEKLERKIAQNDKWFKHVTNIRKAVEALKIKHVVSPRATFKGAKLLSFGYDWKKATKEVIYKSLSEKDIKRINQYIKDNKLDA